MQKVLEYILGKVNDLSCIREDVELHEIRELLYFLDDEELLCIHKLLKDLLEKDLDKQSENDYGRYDSLNMPYDDECDGRNCFMYHKKNFKDFDYWGKYYFLSTEVCARLDTFKKKKQYISKRVDEILSGINEGRTVLNDEVMRELEDRYYYQTNVTKRRIIDCYLKSNKKEAIHNACLLLLNASVWTIKYLEPIQRLWEIYHTSELANLVLKHSSKEYLLKHQVLLGSINYYQLCKRLMHTSGFVIDEDKICNKLVYFHLLKEQGADISSNSIFQFLFRSILTTLAKKELNINEMHWSYNSYYKTSVESVLNHCYTLFNEYGYSYLSTKDFDNVKSVITLFRGLKRLDDIMYYLDWDKKIQSICYDKFNQCAVYSKQTQQQSVNLMKRLFIQTIIQEFPEEYSYLLKEISIKKYVKMSDESFEDRAPQLLNMIKEFDLEPIKDHH